MNPDYDAIDNVIQGIIDEFKEKQRVEQEELSKNISNIIGEKEYVLNNGDTVYYYPERPDLGPTTIKEAIHLYELQKITEIFGIDYFFQNTQPLIRATNIDACYDAMPIISRQESCFNCVDTLPSPVTYVQETFA